MSPCDSEDDAKKLQRLAEPLCLFCYPDAGDVSPGGEVEAYVEGDGKATHVEPRKDIRKRHFLRRDKENDGWHGRRTEMGVRRRGNRLRDTGRHLKSHFLTSVTPERIQGNDYVSHLIGALATLKDAWPPSRRFAIDGFTDGDDDSCLNEMHNLAKEYKVIPVRVTRLYQNRRASVPEEAMRRHTVKRAAATSEESGENRTMPEPTSTSSRDQEETVTGYGEPSSSGKSGLEREPDGTSDGGRAVGSNDAANGSERLREGCARESDGNGGAASFDASKYSACLKRVTQNEYDRQGKGIIRTKTKERGSQTGRFSGRSETTPTAVEETDDGRTSESLVSSSPVELPRQTAQDVVSSSGNISSESEDMKCTCAELTSSKDTSTDLYRSGKSTLSQTISEKSVSTQDSTVSIHSVSTGGSTVGTETTCDTTSPDVFPTTSAKENTPTDCTPRNDFHVGPDPRPVRRRIDRHAFAKKCHGFHGRRCRRWRRYRSSSSSSSCGKSAVKGKTLSKQLRDDCSNAGKRTAGDQTETRRTPPPPGANERTTYERGLGHSDGVAASDYPRNKCSREEMHLFQEMRHRKCVENRRRYSIPLSENPRASSSQTGCASGGTSCKELSDADARVLIPRYSAIPRTLSMLVNTSSGDASAVNTDSDSLSLTDSLEDVHVTHTHRYDTKKEMKPVRGDVNAIQETKKKVKQQRPRPRAFFISIKDPYGEDELVGGISRIPEPPERIKNGIKERQLNLLRMRKVNMEKKKRGELRERKSRRRTLRGIDGKPRHKSEPRANASSEGFRSGRPAGLAATGEGILARNYEGCESEAGENNHPGRKGDSEQATSKIPVRIHAPLPSVTLPQAAANRKQTRRGREHRTVADVKSSNGKARAEEDAFAPIPEPVTERPPKVDEAPPTTAVKPQAVIHPSQMPSSDPELLLRKQILPGSCRVGRFRQKFDIIPEEKSSSLSSAEEKKANEPVRRVSMPVKLGTSPSEGRDQERTVLRRYSLGTAPDLLFAKFMGRSLQAVQCIHGRCNSDQQIIVLSPKRVANANSRKGRDALIAINREDFHRLSKGWMNFYMLNENSDASEESDREDEDDNRRLNEMVQLLEEGGRCPREKEKKNGKRSESRQRESDLAQPSSAEAKTFGIVQRESERPSSDNLNDGNPTRERDRVRPHREPVRGKHIKEPLNESFRFHSSNTLLTPPSKPPSRGYEKNILLPQLNPSASSGTDRQPPKAKDSVPTLPKVARRYSDTEGQDSDGTVNCKAPALVVPRLAFDGSMDFPSDVVSSSSNNETDQKPKRTPSMPSRPPQPQRKHPLLQRFRHKREGHRDAVLRKGHPGWSVTVEGTLELTSSAPELEMKLSFPANGSSPPQANQSDSGFAEEVSHNIVASGRDHPESTLTPDGTAKHTLTVTVTNPAPGDAQGVTRRLSRNRHLPDLRQTQQRNEKPMLKNSSNKTNVANRDRKISLYWPNIDISQCEGVEEVMDDEELSVRGNAIPMDKKPRSQSMTEKDLTRGNNTKCAHSNDNSFLNGMDKLR